MERVCGKTSSASGYAQGVETASSSKKARLSSELVEQRLLPEKALGERNVYYVMDTFIDALGKHPADQLGITKFGALKNAYRDDLFKGLLFSLLPEVRVVPPVRSTVKAQGPLGMDKRNEVFIRDPLLLFNDQTKIVAVYSKIYESDKKTIVDTVKDTPGCPAIDIIRLDSSMDGGNVIYSAERKLLLHGDNAVENYKEDDLRCTEVSRELKDKLFKYGIDVLGVRLNRKLYPVTIKNKFFHLDLVMHSLPNGIFLVLNKKLFAPGSFELLEKVLGESLVDLQCSLTDIKNLPPMNLVSFVDKDGVVIISNNIRDELLEKLSAFGKVITINTLDSRSLRYDEVLSQKVAMYLSSIGYKDINASTLLQALPCRLSYLVRVDEEYQRIDYEKYYHEVMSNLSSSPDQVLSDSQLDFFTTGGPHCLTQNVSFTAAP
ncbi:hypothetical protein ElyMa_001677700 [Elysia marginata]|uniref:Arginine deiminase n=1 Tax=Elysia marginata TaxID=1093978 RepID=A0AAV4JQR5_9GAST|nr:hypothetical protein ElyMa_001677700 [Elysia marginata]